MWVTAIYYVLLPAMLLKLKEHCDSWVALTVARLLLTVVDLIHYLLTAGIDNCSTVLLDSLNRGGLVKRTLFVFSLATKWWKVFEKNTRRKKSSKPVPKFNWTTSAFCVVLDRVLYSEDNYQIVLGNNKYSLGDKHRVPNIQLLRKELFKAINRHCRTIVFE